MKNKKTKVKKIPFLLLITFLLTGAFYFASLGYNLLSFIFILSFCLTIHCMFFVFNKNLKDIQLDLCNLNEVFSDILTKDTKNIKVKQLTEEEFLDIIKKNSIGEDKNDDR